MVCTTGRNEEFHKDLNKTLGPYRHSPDYFYSVLIAICVSRNLKLLRKFKRDEDFPALKLSAMHFNAFIRLQERSGDPVLSYPQLSLAKPDMYTATYFHNFLFAERTEYPAPLAQAASEAETFVNTAILQALCRPMARGMMRQAYSQHHDTMDAESKDIVRAAERDQQGTSQYLHTAIMMKASEYAKSVKQTVVTVSGTKRKRYYAKAKVSTLKSRMLGRLDDHGAARFVNPRNCGSMLAQFSVRVMYGPLHDLQSNVIQRDPNWDVPNMALFSALYPILYRRVSVATDGVRFVNMLHKLWCFFADTDPRISGECQHSSLWSVACVVCGMC